MIFNFVYDRFIDDASPYPNLAPLTDISQGTEQLELEWPRIIPVRLLDYCDQHQYPYQLHTVDSVYPATAWYPVGIGWFDYSIDYFGLMTDQVLDRLRARQLRVLFYYHEGDDPTGESLRLNALCDLHSVPHDCYRFVSGNTAADSVDNFVYFADHELFYWQCTRSSAAVTAHENPRSHRYTALVRRHQAWRAMCLAWMHQQGIVDDRSYWSYNGVGLAGRDTDYFRDNPVYLSKYYPGLQQQPGLWEYAHWFVTQCPWQSADQLSSDQHNSHDILVEAHYSDSYINIVLETLYDAEQSSGAFLTEKTFKPIRNGQPFVVIGTPGSLATLRRLGYRTFDSVIDASYDGLDNDSRWAAIQQLLTQLDHADLHAVYQACLADIQHNQQLFLAPKYNRIQELDDKLTH